jgi:hypothetical protein
MNVLFGSRDNLPLLYRAGDLIARLLPPLRQLWADQVSAGVLDRMTEIVEEINQLGVFRRTRLQAAQHYIGQARRFVPYGGGAALIAQLELAAAILQELGEDLERAIREARMPDDRSQNRAARYY